MTGIVAALTAPNARAKVSGWFTIDARQILNDHDITEIGWLALNPGADRCGCLDDRCIGHHHAEHDECSCLSAVLETGTRQPAGIVAALTGFEAQP